MQGALIDCFDVIMRISNNYKLVETCIMFLSVNKVSEFRTVHFSWPDEKWRRCNKNISRMEKKKNKSTINYIIIGELMKQLAINGKWNARWWKTEAYNYLIYIFIKEVFKTNFVYQMNTVFR